MKRFLTFVMALALVGQANAFVRDFLYAIEPHLLRRRHTACEVQLLRIKDYAVHIKDDVPVLFLLTFIHRSCFVS